MRHALHNIAIFCNLLLLRASDRPQANEHLLREFYSDYNDVCKKTVKKFSGHFVGDKCCDMDGHIDLKNRLVPFLDDLKRRPEQVNAVSSTSLPAGLDTVDKQLFELLETCVINKDIIRSTMSESARICLNRCTLTRLLASYYCGSSAANSFSAFLRNSIVYDFTALGLGGSMLNDVTEKVDRAFTLLKDAGMVLQKYIGSGNPKAVENMKAMACIPEEQGQVVTLPSLLLSFAAPAQNGGTGASLSHETLDRLEKALDSMYMYMHAPIMSELFCYCFILLTTEIENNHGSVPPEVKNRYIKTFSDLEILDGTAVLFYDLPTMAKTGRPKFSRDICRNALAHICENSVFETFHEAIKKAYLENPNAQIDDVLKAAFGTIKQSLAASGRKTETYTNRNSKLVVVDILANLCWSMLLSTFEIDSGANPEDITREIELFGDRLTSPKRLYLCEMPDILDILATEGPIDTAAQGNAVGAFLKAGSQHNKYWSSAESAKHVLMHISRITEHIHAINQYKTYIISSGSALFGIDVALLLVYWRALRSNKISTGE